MRSLAVTLRWVTLYLPLSQELSLIDVHLSLTALAVILDIAIYNVIPISQ